MDGEMSLKWTFTTFSHQTLACCGHQRSQLYLWPVMWGGVEPHFLHRTLLLAGCIREGSVHRESLSSRTAVLGHLSEGNVLRRSGWFNSSGCVLSDVKWKSLSTPNISVVMSFSCDCDLLSTLWTVLLGLNFKVGLLFRCWTASGCLMTFSCLLLTVSKSGLFSLKGCVSRADFKWNILRSRNYKAHEHFTWCSDRKRGANC